MRCHTWKSARRNYFITLTLFFLSACGGGGGSATGSDPSPVADFPPPGLATPVYSGKTTQGTASQSDGRVLAIETQRSLDLVASLPMRMYKIVAPHLTTFGMTTIFNKGPDKQHKFPRFYGIDVGDGTGWLETTFSGYRSSDTGINDFFASLRDVGVTLDHNPLHGTYTYSGTAVVQVVTSADSSPFHVILSCKDLRIKGDRFDYTLNGSIDTDFAGYGVSPPIFNQGSKAELSIKDALSGHTWLLSGFEVDSHSSLDNAPITATVSASGSLSDSAVGRLDVSTPATKLHYYYNAYDVGPAAGGYLKLAGKGSSSIFFSGLNYEFWSLGFDSSGVGIPTQSQRFSWVTDQPDSTPASASGAPVAYANVMTIPTLQSAGILDGRLSYGILPLTYTWSVELGQPDGHPKFNDAHSAMPTFSASKAGQYLVRLTVSDGTQQGVDHVLVEVGMTTGENGIVVRPRSGPGNILGTIGQPVMLDARLGHNELGDTPGKTFDQWTFIPPAGSAAVLQGASSASPSFTPDVAGYYMLSDASRLPIVVNVGEPYQYSPSVLFLPNLYYLAATDMFGAGHTDIVYSSISPQRIGILKNLGQGAFHSVDSFDFALNNGSYLDVGDLDGDGRPDVAVDIGNSAQLLKQKADGTFVKGAKLTPSCAHNPISSFVPMRIAKLANDSLGSVLYSGKCVDGIHVFHNDGAGNLSDAAVVPIAQTAWQIGDVTNDGIPDIITTSYSLFDPAVADMLVNPGKSDGTFDTPATYSLGTDVNPELTTGGGGGIASYFVGDMDNDGVNDVTTLVYSRFSNVDDSLRFFDQQSGALVTPGVSVQVPNNLSCYSLHDMDGDSKVDLVYTTGNTIAVMLQDGTQSFASPVIVPVGDVTLTSCSSGLHAGQLQVLDLDGDGIPDLILPDGSVRMGEIPGQ